MPRSNGLGRVRAAATLLVAGGACLLLALLSPVPAGAQTSPIPLDRPAAESSPRAASQALERARTLLAENRRDDALAVLDAALQDSPSDAQLRFQRGVLLAQMGRSDEAVEVFTELTRQFPELPEPHNNLAALRAQRGELDLARQALEDALRALPSYSLAHENLGDVQLRLAERSYQRAVDADAGNRAAREKLERTRELIARISTSAAAQAPAARAGASQPSETPASR